MRPYFSDIKRLKQQAKDNRKTGSYYLKQWWVRKYDRPINDPLFQGQTEGALQLEWFEDLYQQREEILANLENKVGDQDTLLRHLNAINSALDIEPEVQDDLVEYWENEVLAGRIPDLDMMPEDLEAMRNA